MPRALWKGAISFGLVNIPVELYSAEERKEFSFSMLDKRDLSPVGNKRYSKNSGKEVEWENIVKGYEYEKGQYVVLSDEDFRRANVKASQTVDIKAFVPAAEIPAQYYETPYFLAPGKRGEKVYALLRETLRSTGRVAIAQVVIRTTQHLAAVVVSDRALMLITMRYQDELRDHQAIELPPAGLKSAGVTAKEVELAKRLIDDMSVQWDPSEFEDTYHEDLMRRIQEKIKRGETAEITEPEKERKSAPRSAQIIDLTELLKKSLRGGKSTGEEAISGKRRAARHAKPAAKTAPAVIAVARQARKAPARRKRA